MKLTVTCTCGKEVPVTKSLAAKVLQQGRVYDPEQMRKASLKGVEARRRKKWEEE